MITVKDLRSRAALPTAGGTDFSVRRGGRVAVIGVLFIMAAVVAAVLAVLNTDRIVSLNMRAAQVRESAFQLDSAYSEVVGLMQATWFGRRWVIQELMLATNAYVRYGSEEMSWSDFAEAISLFTSIHPHTK